MSLHESFWTYKNFRYLKLSLLLVVALSAYYTVSTPLGGHNGGTVFGYTLGTFSALMMLWLTWFGYRKRSYYSSGAPLRGWLSAHVYLGTTLVLLVPLHSGFQFAANLHTLAYVLMSAVVISGIVGVSLYSSIPSEMTANRPGEKLDTLLERIADLDTDSRTAAEDLPDSISRAVAVSINETRIGGGLRRQLAGVDPSCGTNRAINTISAETLTLEGPVRAEAQKILELLSLKRTLVARVRRDVRLKALLDLWLVFHVPMAFASIAAVAAHIVVVFYYR